MVSSAHEEPTHSPTGHTLLLRLRQLPAFYDRPALAGWQGSVPTLRLRQGDVLGECSPLEMLRPASKTEILPEGGHDFRGFRARPRQMVDSRMARCELQEWHQ